MARIETDPNYTSPTFSRATAATDPFKKEDVQLVAAALSTHDHSTGKGLPMSAGSIPTGTITSAMIADGTIDTADLKDGAVTSAKIADGTIQSADIAAAGIANDRLGPDVARENQLTNGGFEIWQRGNGPFSLGVGQWTADRWQVSGVGGDSISVSRDTANVDTGSGACAAVTFTKATGTTSLVQAVANDMPSLIGRSVALSLRVRTSTANAVRVGIYNGSAWVYSAYHSGSGTYQTLTVTATLTSGSNVGLTGVAFDASCTAYLDNASLVVGSQAANYVPMAPADDLARCLRYYQRWAPGGANSVLAVNYAYATTAALASFPLTTIMAVAPTVTASAPTDWGMASGAGGLNACTAMTLTAQSGGRGPVSATGTVAGGLVVGQAGPFGTMNSNAWISAEANP